MADLIPPGAGDPASAQAAPAPQEGSAQAPAGPAPGQGAPDPATQPAALIPADAQGQQLDGADQGGPRAKGTEKDAQDAAVDADPEAEVPASPEEQKQYDSLVSRFLLFISDPRKASDKHASPNESVLAMLNVPHVPAAIALGRATANVVFTLMQSAKAQGKPYDAEVVFHAADEIIPAMYLMGAAHGIWKGLPPFHGMAADGSYEFNDDEIKVMGEAKMQGTRFLGKLMVHAGWITSDVAQANAALWKQRIEQEVAHGNVSDEVLEKLAQAGTFDKIHDQLGTSGFSGFTGQAGPASPADAGTPPPASDSFPADAGTPGAAPTATGDA